MSEILTKARQISQELVTWRRWFHQHPELGFEEIETARYIEELLANWGLKVEHVGSTGLLVVLQGSTTGPVLALRADMDALPVTEQTGLSFASLRPGVMHACGHDAHLAILLGTIRLLQAERHRLSGTLKFIFQPSEENPPGGALDLIQRGVLKEPQVDAVVGLHVSPGFPAGCVALKEGVTMAAADLFEVAVQGRGGHGSAPHQARDPVVAAAEMILAMQTAVSRRLNPLEPAVVSVGTVAAGTRPNVIPEEVRLSGTIRSLKDETRRQLPCWLENIVTGVARAHDVQAEFKYLEGYPPVVNDASLTAQVRRAAARVVGSLRVLELVEPSMGGEDFAYYAQKVPGCYFYLGVKSGEGNLEPWHSPRFVLDERALPVGAAVLAQVALDFLRSAESGK